MDGTGQVVARNVKRLRTRQGMSQQALVGKLGELGYPLDRSAVARMERPGNRKVSVDDLVALAVVLNTSPINLLTPSGPDDVVAVTPKTEITGRQMRRWCRGWEPLDAQDSGSFHDQAARTDWFFLHDSLFLSYADLIEREAEAALRNDEQERLEAATLAHAVGGTVADRLMSAEQPPENPAVAMLRDAPEPSDG